jgi:hypothetical protein
MVSARPFFRLSDMGDPLHSRLLEVTEFQHEFHVAKRRRLERLAELRAQEPPWVRELQSLILLELRVLDARLDALYAETFLLPLAMAEVRRALEWEALVVAFARLRLG